MESQIGGNGLVYCCRAKPTIYSIKNSFFFFVYVFHLRDWITCIGWFWCFKSINIFRRKNLNPEMEGHLLFWLAFRPNIIWPRMVWLVCGKAPVKTIKAALTFFFFGWKSDLSYHVPLNNLKHGPSKIFLPPLQIGLVGRKSTVCFHSSNINCWPYWAKAKEPFVLMSMLKKMRRILYM